MTLTHRAVVPLRILLVLLFAFLVFAQTFMMPGQFLHMADEDADFAPYAWPMLAFSIVEIACVQVVVVCLWKLLAMVERDQIFRAEAHAWVDRIVAAIGVAWVLLLGLSAVLAPTFNDPAAPLMLTLLLIAGAVLGLLMVVMRALLRQATTLRADMDAVI